MKRGQLVMAALTGDYGKIRPLLVVQADSFDSFDSVIVCPLTSNVGLMGALRVRIDPAEINQLTVASTVMVEKISAIEKTKIRSELGRVTEVQLAQVTDGLALMLGIAS